MREQGANHAAASFRAGDSQIQQNLHEPLRLPVLAKLAHYSVRQFQREFQRVYKTTPVRFVSQLRLREACEWLRNPETEITSVAVDRGYSSVSFFPKHCKLETGLTPSEYRRRGLEERNNQNRHKLIIESLSQARTLPRLPKARWQNSVAMSCR